MARNKSKDDRMRSTENWERARGAAKKSNPYYTPIFITDKNGNKRKVYILRKNVHKYGNLLSELNN